MASMHSTTSVAPNAFDRERLEKFAAWHGSCVRRGMLHRIVKTALIGAAAIWFIGLRREQAARLRNVIDSNANADGPAGSHADSFVDVPVAKAVDDDERIAATSSTQSVMQSVTQPVA